MDYALKMAEFLNTAQHSRDTTVHCTVLNISTTALTTTQKKINFGIQ